MPDVPIQAAQELDFDTEQVMMEQIIQQKKEKIEVIEIVVDNPFYPSASTTLISPPALAPVTLPSFLPATGSMAK